VSLFKGMSGEPKSLWRRSSVTEHGIAYGARAQGDGVPIVVVGVTPRRGERESHSQGEVAQVTG